MGEGGPVRRFVVRRSEPPLLTSGTLSDTICSYLCSITSDVLFRLFAFHPAAAELFRKPRRRGNFLAARLERREQRCAQGGPELVPVPAKERSDQSGPPESGSALADGERPEVGSIRGP